MHSGAGRIARIKMRPMSLYESGNSRGDVSLENLYSDKLTPVMTGEVSLMDLIGYIIKGGWPGNLNAPIEQAALLPIQYIDETAKNLLDTNRKIKNDPKDSPPSRCYA